MDPALGPDFSGLSASVTTGSLTAVLIAVGGIMIGPRLVKMGINWGRAK